MEITILSWYSVWFQFAGVGLVAQDEPYHLRSVSLCTFVLIENRWTVAAAAQTPAAQPFESVCSMPCCLLYTIPRCPVVRLWVGILTWERGSKLTGTSVALEPSPSDEMTTLLPANIPQDRGANWQLRLDLEFHTLALRYYAVELLMQVSLHYETPWVTGVWPPSLSLLLSTECGKELTTSKILHIQGGSKK